MAVSIELARRTLNEWFPGHKAAIKMVAIALAVVIVVVAVSLPFLLE